MGRFLKIDRAVDRFGYWVGAYTIMSGGFAWLASKMEALHIGWAEAVFIGVFVAGGVTLVVSTGLVAWRQFHPLPGQSSPDSTELERLIDARLQARTDLATHADLHRHDEQLVELSERTTFVRKMVESGHSGLKARLDEIAKGCSDLEQRWNEWTRQHSNDQEARFDNVDFGFAAIINREWNERLFAELREGFVEIAEPVEAKKPIADAGRWQMLVTNWRSKLDQWLVIADYYAVNTRENVLIVPDHLYYGTWSLAEDRLTADQVKMYKEAAIWRMSAKAAKPRVDRCLAAAAFESPSRKGRSGSPPRIGSNG